MGKAPAFQFYPNDWLGDVELQAASSSSRGIWINALCRMWHSKTKGEIHGDETMLSRILSCTKEELAVFFREAEALGFCYVSRNPNGILTLRNRRMYREEKEREANRLRQQRHYRKRQSNGQPNDSLTSPSSSSTSNNIGEVITPIDNSNVGEETACAELPKGTPAPTPIPSSSTFIKIPLVHKNKDATAEEFSVTQEMVNEWIDAFPAVLIEQELREIRQWNLARPKQRKTRAGIVKHITGWLAKEQDKGGPPIRGSPPSSGGNGGSPAKQLPSECEECRKKNIQVQWHDGQKKHLCRDCYTGGLTPEDISRKLGEVMSKAFGRRM